MTTTVQVYGRIDELDLADGRTLRFERRARIEGEPGGRIRVRARIELVEIGDPDRLAGTEVVEIRAQKGAGHACYPACEAAGHRYRHEFGPGAATISLVDGDLVLDGPEPLWDWFEIEEATRWR